MRENRWLVTSLPLGLGIAAMALTFVEQGGAAAQTSLPPGTTRYVLNVPPGFPPPPLPLDNPLTVQGVSLGQRLFNDVRLSGTNTQACASCHRPQFAFSDAGKATSVGIDGIKGSRNAPGLFNLAYQRRFFWDGRSPSLRNQALQPIQNPIEMHESLAQAVAKLQADPTYPAMFQQAFGTVGITPARIGLALEQFELTLYSGNSKFDAWQRDQASFTAQEARGFQLFRTPFNPQMGQFGADCARCHGGPLFSDFTFKNNGLDAHPLDVGLMAVTDNPWDLGKFKTPSLRNLPSTGPFMHDGRMASLEEVVQHYSTGIQPSKTLDPGLAREQGGVHLSLADQAALVAFLKTLQDPKFTPLSPAP